MRPSTQAMVTSHESRARTRAPLASFHPIVRRWFTDEIGTPTPAQARGWAAIRDGRHTLIAAPTGSGKTLAAFLIALDDLLQEGLAGPLPDEVRVRLRVAAQGAEQRHPQEPRRAARRHRAAGGGRWASTARASPPRSAPATRPGRARGDAPQAAAHPRDHARVALPAADRRSAAASGCGTCGR